MQAAGMYVLPLVAAELLFRVFFSRVWLQVILFSHTARYDFNFHEHRHIFSRGTPPKQFHQQIFYWFHNLFFALMVFSKVFYAKRGPVDIFKNEPLFKRYPCGSVSWPWHVWNSGLENCVLWELYHAAGDAQQHNGLLPTRYQQRLPGSNSQKSLQTLPSVPWGGCAQPLLGENHCALCGTGRGCKA